MSEFKLETYSDEELIARFNRDVGNPGWGASRSRWGSEFSDEVQRRGWIYPEEWLAGGVSFGRRVVLVGNTVEFEKPIDAE
jgi:hypothetical protein